HRHSRPRLSITGFQPVIPRRHPVITEYLQQGRDLCINKTDLSPVNSFTLLCMALHSGAIQGNTAHIVK
ncbi:unnamed protein product, partial [Staurois parvus]